MSVETVESFAKRATDCVTKIDRQAYKDLFELPCAVWGDDGCDLRLTEARLDRVFDTIEGNLNALGKPRHRRRLDAVRLIGERLTVARVLTWLELDDPAMRTDPTSELWILRERGGRLHLVGLVNPMSAHLLSDDAAAAEPAEAEEAGGPATPRAFIDAILDMIRNRDIEANLRLIGLPYLRFGDGVTGLIRTPNERLRMAETAHRLIGPRAGGAARIDLLAERPYGRSLTCLRILFHGIRPNGAEHDPREELWVPRDAGRDLQLLGVVNPATATITKT